MNIIMNISKVFEKSELKIYKKWFHFCMFWSPSQTVEQLKSKLVLLTNYNFEELQSMQFYSMDMFKSYGHIKKPK